MATLSLSSLPSWDASEKVLKVLSLTPIAQLPNLQHLELFGVCPPDRHLPIQVTSKKLNSARFSKYLQSEVQRFYESTGAANIYAPEAVYDAA